MLERGIELVERQTAFGRKRNARPKEDRRGRPVRLLRQVRQAVEDGIDLARPFRIKPVHETHYPVLSSQLTQRSPALRLVSAGSGSAALTAFDRRRRRRRWRRSGFWRRRSHSRLCRERSWRTHQRNRDAALKQIAGRDGIDVIPCHLRLVSGDCYRNIEALDQTVLGRENAILRIELRKTRGLGLLLHVVARVLRIEHIEQRAPADVELLTV